MTQRDAIAKSIADWFVANGQSGVARDATDPLTLDYIDICDVPGERDMGIDCRLIADAIIADGEV